MVQKNIKYSEIKNSKYCAKEILKIVKNNIKYGAEKYKIFSRK